MSKRAAPAIVSAWSSCVEMPIQRLFLALCAAKGHQIRSADSQNAHTHAEACGIETRIQADNACIEWAQEILQKDVRRGSVMKVSHSLQRHPLSGKLWMGMIDKILIDDLGFSTTAHDQCIHKRTDPEGTILILRQVDDFLIGTTDESIAERITKRIGKRVKFQHEENLPMTFLGLAEDCNGVNVEQFNNLIPMSSKGYIERMLKTHGWNKESPDSPKPCRDGVKLRDIWFLPCQQIASHGFVKKKVSRRAQSNTASLKRKWDFNVGLCWGN